MSFINYDDIIKSSPVVLVEFYADWCPHCQKMMPVMDEIRELLDAPRVSLHQLNIDENEKIADQAGVTGVPYFLLYRNGECVWRDSGEIDGNVIMEQVSRAEK